MAKTDFEPLSWEEAEANRQEQARHAELMQAQSTIKTAEECEKLKSEIKRGKEYLEKVRAELAEIREILEEWPTYELRCGKNPLGHFKESVLVNERVIGFLTGWLARREKRLQKVSRAVGANAAADEKVETRLAA